MNHQKTNCEHCFKPLFNFQGFSFMSTNLPELEETLPFFCQTCFQIPGTQVWLQQQQKKMLSLMRQTAPPKSHKISLKTFQKIIKDLS